MTEKFQKDAWIMRALKQGVYRVRSSDGAVFKVILTSDPANPISVRKIKFSTHKPSGRVYFTMTFEGISKSVLANRVVGLALHPNPRSLAEVNHIDGDKANNRPDNLEWASRSDQEKHAFATNLKSSRGSQNSNAKLTVDDVQRIRHTHAAYPLTTLAELAKIYKVSAGTISGILKRKTWSHL